MAQTGEMLVGPSAHGHEKHNEAASVIIARSASKAGR